jgi:hypothetical protein
MYTFCPILLFVFLRALQACVHYFSAYLRIIVRGADILIKFELFSPKTSDVLVIYCNVLGYPRY